MKSGKFPRGWIATWGDDPDNPDLQRATYIRYYPIIERHKHLGTAVAFVWSVAGFWIVVVAVPARNWCSDYISMNTSVGARRKATTIVRGLR